MEDGMDLSHVSDILDLDDADIAEAVNPLVIDRLCMGLNVGYEE